MYVLDRKGCVTEVPQPPVLQRPLSWIARKLRGEVPLDGLVDLFMFDLYARSGQVPEFHFRTSDRDGSRALVVELSVLISEPTERRFIDKAKVWLEESGFGELEVRFDFRPQRRRR